jgi:hypothetical protein
MKNWTIILPWILSFITLGAGIWQYADKSAQSNKAPFLEKQLEISFEASDVAARLATETNADEWEKARKDFWRLYWGPLGIVEDKAVEAAMVALGKIVPKLADENLELPMATLEQPSLQLALATRNLILGSWKVDIPALKGKP